MLWVSRILADLVKQYITSVSQSAGEYRLVVPGLTSKIGEELHEVMQMEGIHSFLVIANGRSPDETKRWLLPKSLTKMRIGSFVAVVDPGALASIQDSIRGSGGAIRGVAFSEEWPWIDDGSETFHFSGPFLSRLIDAWSLIQEERDWLKTFIEAYLVDCMRRDTDRAVIFLERILGEFVPTASQSLGSIRERFLLHCGIPRPANATNTPAQLTKETRSLVSRIIDRLRTEPDLRSQVLENIDANASDASAIRSAIDTFFDGLAHPSVLDGDILALQHCWGGPTAKLKNWCCLTISQLRQLFEIQEQRPVELDSAFQPALGILVSKDGRSVAAPFDTNLIIKVHYNIPIEDFTDRNCRLLLAIRNRQVSEQVLPTASGDLQLELNIKDIGISYRNRVPVRLSIFIDDESRAGDRLVVHSCGAQRPAFVVTTPGFGVNDAVAASKDDPAPERRHLINGPIRLHLFVSEPIQPEVVRDDGSIEQLSRNNSVWETTESIDVFDEPSSQTTRDCHLGERWVSLAFEAEDIDRGEFTIEDELRQLQISAKKERVGEALSRFTGHTTEVYSRLGGLNEESRRRTRLAKYFEHDDGWGVILADLLQQPDGVAKKCGSFARRIGQADASAISTVVLPDSARDILWQYIEKRSAFRQEVLSSLQVSGTGGEHPEYAVYPFYLTEESKRRRLFEQALSGYLLAHGQLQTYLHNNQGKLDWPQAFVLTYLDCVVQWREDTSRNSIFLIGPWHPLVAAKRFLVQHALVSRAQRMIHGDKEFHELIGLLAQINGFHWHPCLKTNDTSFEPAHVTPTSDPGWHFAFKRNVANINSVGTATSFLEDALQAIRKTLGLDTRIHLPASGAMVETVLRSYLHTFPAKRHIGVYFPSGFHGEDEIVTVDRFLHSDDGSTMAGQKLVGGLNLLFHDMPSFPEDAVWTGPPLQVYQYESLNACLAEQHPDIQFCRTVNQLDFLEIPDLRRLPRGRKHDAVFSQSVSRLTQGQTSIPQSVTEEWDIASENRPAQEASIGELFTYNCGLACALSGRPHGVVHATSLPLRLDTAWTVVPGAVIDPAVFVKYVRDGKERQIEERALWDYRVSMAKASTSFFVLSKIPAAFRSAVNGLFDYTGDLACEFVTELGRIGLAIAGEAMKSGRHALGAVGLVGAVRLFSGHGNNTGPLCWSNKTVGFLLPVDSFREILTGDGVIPDRSSGDERRRRADLLAVVLRLPDAPGKIMAIQAVAIECKFVSGTFPDAQIQRALEQASATTEQMRRLCRIASTPAGIPERLALLQLIRFGLRITGTHDQGDTPKQLEIGRCVFEAILCGDIEYCPARTGAVLVSTEMSLHGSAELNHPSMGLWVRLNRENWPGVAESASLGIIRQEIVDLFSTLVEPTMGGETVRDLPNITSTDQDMGAAVTISAQHSESPNSTTYEARVVEEKSSITPETINSASEHSGVDSMIVQGVKLKRIFVGVDAGRRSIYFDPHSSEDRLDNANMMVTGSSGKGKTQLLKYLITAIRDQGANTLVLDFKNDFASDSHFVNQARLTSTLLVFDGMPFNPLIPYPITDSRSGGLFIQCAQHITGIASVLRRTYRLGPQQEAAVKNAIRQAFAEAGIDPAATVAYDPTTIFPDFARVGEILEQTNTAGYNRLDPLFTLNLFREEHRRSSFAEMVNLSSAIDFSQIPSDPLKNALAELIVISAHAYFNSQPHCGTLRQVFVVDEASRILGADYIERFALECRAYGLGLLLSSQYPDHFPAGISSSLATKIIHGNDQDIERVRDIVNLLGCPEREAEIANLGMFEAIFSNKHFRTAMLRTITYPLYLLLAALQSSSEMSLDEIAHIEGIDTHKLSVSNLVRYLERMGFCETVDDKVRLIIRDYILHPGLFMSL